MPGPDASAVLDAVEPPPRVVDWSILVLVGFQVASGLVSLVTGDAGGAYVFWLHGIAGFALLFVLAFKLRRVRHRIAGRDRLDRTRTVSVLTGVLALAALGTGIAWVLGVEAPLGFWTLLNLHILLGLLLVPLVVVHLSARYRPPRSVDLRSRRTALQVSGLLVAGALVWRAQGVVNRVLDTAGADRRFTGSRRVEGASFPVTSWVADDPDPVDLGAWTLSVRGWVEASFDLAYADLDSGTEQEALLDCTSGWYTVQDWRGVRVGDLLDRAGVAADARWVRFTSVTGYRWSLPLEEARDALLATHVGGDPLTHGHGRPLRLVAPGRRGFQWVKWVESVEVRRRRDLGQWLAIFVSGFA